MSTPEMSPHPTPWRKSSYSGAETANCVEVAWTHHDSEGSGGTAPDAPPLGATLRDSKHPHHSVLPFTPRAWTAFLSGLKNGEDL